MENKSNKLFVNKTTNTKEAYIEFLKFHGKTFNLAYIAYTVLWTFLFILCIILAFSSGARLQGVGMTIILIIFLSYRFLRPKMIVKNELESDKVSPTSTNTYSFYENNFMIKNKNGVFTYKYFTIRKVYETSNYFYLYVSKENAFLLSKQTFSLGNAKTFAQFMKKKCVLKYKVSL